MSPATKAAAQRKLASLKVKVGYPDRWRDYGGLKIASDDLYGNDDRGRRYEGGLNLALDAYHASLHGKPAPIIDGFSGDQRLFLGYAQAWRIKRRDDSIRRMLVADPHAPEMYRVNGIVRNVDAWYAAFNATSTGKLYLSTSALAYIW
jgi:predicted metalloendopeptidase